MDRPDVFVTELDGHTWHVWVAGFMKYPARQTAKNRRRMRERKRDKERDRKRERGERPILKTEILCQCFRMGHLRGVLFEGAASSSFFGNARWAINPVISQSVLLWGMGLMTSECFRLLDVLWCYLGQAPRHVTCVVSAAVDKATG